MKDFMESVNHGVARILNQVKMNGFNVGKINIHRDRDVRVDYSVELVDQNGNTYLGHGTAIRRPKTATKNADKPNKMIGHQVAYSRALKNALSVATSTAK